MPTSAAIACAVAALSPVSIHTSRPSAFSWATASAESGLTGSATTIRPAASASTAANMGVWPLAAAWSASAVNVVMSMPASVRSAALPAKTRWPSTVASMPRPGTAVKRSSGGSARSRGRGDDRLAQRVFAAGLGGRHEREQGRRVPAGRRFGSGSRRAGRG